VHFFFFIWKKNLNGALPRKMGSQHPKAKDQKGPLPGAKVRE
jgi:hypothetical protein